MSIDAMKQALATLNDYEPNEAHKVATALRAAIEQAQEPVAWISEGGDVSRSKRYMDEMGFKCNPLYTAPRQWQGLTDEEREQVINANFATGLWQMAKDIEAKLKEKNNAR